MELFVVVLVPIAALVILLVLIAKSSNHTSRIANLEWHLSRLQALERQVSELGATISSLKEQIAGLTGPGSRKKAVSRGKEKPATPPPKPVAAAHPPAPTVAPQQAVQQTPSRTREEWEALIGGKLFNRIGALALFIGIGYFLKYAFDNNWISETARVLIGAAIGFACLAGGYRTNTRGFQVFAQGLGGAGIAILYLAVYAAFNFYQLVPQWVAFVLMAIVTVIAFANGLFYDSLAEAILGWAGGFLTPVLLSTGHSNEIGLFTYIVLLDAGMLAMVWKKERWWVLEPLTFVGTWILYVAWSNQYYTEADLGITVLFATLFWLLFLLLDYFRSSGKEERGILVQIVPAFNAFVYFLVVYDLVNKDHHAWMGLITLAVGLVYFLFYLGRQRGGAGSRQENVRTVLTAVAFVVAATSIQLYDFNTVMAWSVEAAALIWIGRIGESKYLNVAGLSLFGLAVLKLLFLTQGALLYFPIAEFSPVLNHRALAFAVVSLALGFAGFQADNWKGERNDFSSNILHSAWCGMLFILVTAETNDYFRFHSLHLTSLLADQMGFYRILSFSVFWISLSIPFIWTGLRRKLIAPVIAALVVTVFAFLFAIIRGMAFDPVENFRPVLNIRTTVLLLVGTGLLLQTQMIQRRPEVFVWLGEIVKVIQVGMMIIIFVLLTGETRDYFEKGIVDLSRGTYTDSAEVSRLSNLQQLMLSGVWLVYSVALMSAGIWRKYRGMRFAAFALFGVTILKIFLYDLSFLETLYRLFSFIALGLILLGVSWAYQRYKDVIFGKRE